MCDWTHVILESVLGVRGIFSPSCEITQIESGSLARNKDSEKNNNTRTAIEFDVFALVLLNCLFDSDQFSVRVRFLELP